MDYPVAGYPVEPVEGWTQAEAGSEISDVNFPVE